MKPFGDQKMTNTDQAARSAGRLYEFEDAVLAQIEPEEVIDFHRSIVRIPTVNPPGDVRAAIAVTGDKLTSGGFAVDIVSNHELMNNVVASIGTNDGPTLAFNAHLDVVPIGDRAAWKYDPFGAEIHDGRIYGRGAGDDKASVAAQVLAGIAVARSGIPLKGRLVVNEVADEEIGGVYGAQFIVREGFFQPDWVIVGEQTLNHVALGEKGSAPTNIIVHGRTAHGALPWEGVNAIEATGEIISALRKELWPILATRTHDHFHPSSGSINLFNGGVKANVVPDKAEIYIDRRLIPGEDPQEAAAEIREIAERAVAGMEGITLEVVLHSLATPAGWTDEQSPFAQAAIAANRRIGLSSDIRGFSMATDGRFFRDAGYPTIIYGPGDPKLAHIPDEWVGIDEIVEAARFYAVAAVKLLADL
jgi:acetylornithine deacetylase/succinyl-diaminopimelate desuccinylase family protein